MRPALCAFALGMAMLCPALVGVAQWVQLPEPSGTAQWVPYAFDDESYLRALGKIPPRVYEQEEARPAWAEKGCTESIINVSENDLGGGMVTRCMPDGAGE